MDVNDFSVTVVLLVYDEVVQLMLWLEIRFLKYYLLGRKYVITQFYLKQGNKQKKTDKQTKKYVLLPVVW